MAFSLRFDVACPICSQVICICIQGTVDFAQRLAVLPLGFLVLLLMIRLRLELSEDPFGFCCCWFGTGSTTTGGGRGLVVGLVVGLVGAPPDARQV